METAEIEENIVEEELTEEQETLREEETEEKNLQSMQSSSRDRAGFIHGLSVGLGIGCISTFIVLWIALFFTPQVPQELRYEQLLSIFIFPLIYLLAVGLISLTAGIVREYYVRQ